MVVLGDKHRVAIEPSMKVPPKRKGNKDNPEHRGLGYAPSMKVPPKRKGNERSFYTIYRVSVALNESPSEKEGKCVVMVGTPYRCT